MDGDIAGCRPQWYQSTGHLFPLCTSLDMLKESQMCVPAVDTPAYCDRFHRDVLALQDHQPTLATLPRHPSTVHLRSTAHTLQPLSRLTTSLCPKYAAAPAIPTTAAWYHFIRRHRWSCMLKMTTMPIVRKPHVAMYQYRSPCRAPITVYVPRRACCCLIKRRLSTRDLPHT